MTGSAPSPDPTAIAAEIVRLASERGPTRSICPSEVARSLAPEDWRPLMGPVRQAAVALTRDGRLDILRKGKPIDPAALRGVIRLRIREP
ncbi:DUF3253 domain-containing protein [Roseomonas sp. CCTCC AB2023176]|uniref:DUF3253 domain-containing protein n=1 Tax=Roseomonas sp. CCTCC AB2023176 TaxID=3342640 RepID=UPI0035D7F97B